LTDAEADGHDALEAARLYGHHFWLPGAVAAVLNPLVEHGRLDEADAVLRDSQLEERHGHSHAHCWAAMLLPARARLRIAQGRLHEGLADLRACGEHYESAANRSPSLWPWRSEAAVVLAALGDSATATELATAELALARAFSGPRALGVALRAAGLVTEGDEALALLQEAAAVQVRSGAALEQARVLVDLGSALRHRGRRSDARQPLREGLDTAVRCGADVLAQRARDELLATGAQLRRERLTGPDALTPSERRVAQLAAQGRSNPDIAQALFLTRRTVETHLTHAYQKLGISSREALAPIID
jgi:ATP/maltotriose-dependent transcriptional regulator MalT